ncbi:TetR/AcrR family transcriptional regulator [Mycobacterium sp. E2497]|uniref:TetR/AcrR family transcriptional regulator n=1 Tax=Mycobacterium sp. E2497 TaxID=1834135 RepID=UPI0007FD09F3|nr:TetR family transcriptional regulator [Mycobacterium sp. E2497]OBI16069.1 TetR family transcriptional regulator [Mycobacterium sp. E2497]
MAEARRSPRSARADATREAILTAAERLFAEHGIADVTHRRIVEAAGQGNNAAVAYHFGTKEDVVRAIERKHAEHIDQLLAQRLLDVGDSADLQDWIACLVRPLTDHLDALGTPTWYARFCAQMMADPVYSKVVTRSALSSPELGTVLDGIKRCLPEIPAAVRAERAMMARLLLNHTCAEYEAAFAEGRPVPRTNWAGVGAAIVEATTGLWRAPVMAATAGTG